MRLNIWHLALLLLLASSGTTQGLRAQTATLEEVIQRCPEKTRFVIVLNNLNALHTTWQKDPSLKKDLAPLLKVLKDERKHRDTHELTTALGMTEMEVIQNFMGDSMAVVLEKPPYENNHSVFMLFKPKPGMLAKGIRLLGLEELVDLPPNLNGVRVFRTGDGAAYLGVMNDWCYLAEGKHREFLRRSAVSMVKGRNLSHAEAFQKNWKKLAPRLKTINAKGQLLTQGFLYSSGSEGDHLIGLTSQADQAGAMKDMRLEFIGNSHKWQVFHKMLSAQAMLMPAAAKDAFIIPGRYELAQTSFFMNPNVPETHKSVKVLNRLFFGRRTTAKMNFHKAILPHLRGQLHSYLLHDHESQKTSWFMAIGQKENSELSSYFTRAMKRAALLVNIARASKDQAPFKLSQMPLPADIPGKLSMMMPESDKPSDELSLDGEEVPFFHGLAFGEMKQLGKSFYIVGTDPVLMKKIMMTETAPVKANADHHYHLGEISIKNVPTFMSEMNRFRLKKLGKTESTDTLDDFDRMKLFTDLMRGVRMDIKIAPNSDLSMTMQINR